MEFNREEFEKGCQKFRKRYPDFTDFEHPGERYPTDERNAKDKLVELYDEEVRPLKTKDPAEFFNKYIHILSTPLPAAGAPVILIFWLTLDDIKKKTAECQSDFGKILQDILANQETSEALTDYGNKTYELCNGKIGPAALRDFLTLLLMLDNPDKFMYDTFSFWNKSASSLIGEKLIKRGAKITKPEFERCQELASRVRSELQNSNFAPKDMLDVQSFLYVMNIEPDIPEIRKIESGISEIIKYVHSQGMHIEERTIKRYRYAMQTRGFVILAGPSGTGKTWLARLYAEAVGAESLLAPVAPNWAANEDLLGYFDPIKNQFHATSFLRFVDKAAASWNEHGDKSPEFHLILDEMNLARIEHYFSLFLSLMEMRRGNIVPETRLTGDRLIRVSPNLKFVGTVNMDETTHGFADKVFDRAQLIELSINFESAEEHIEERLGNTECTDVLLELWKAMEPASPVGFRVLDDIIDYIELAGKSDTHWRVALDEQIVSKLLPKLRGIEPEAAEALRNVKKLVDTNYPLATSKCEIMLRRYEATDVVSYF